MSAKVTAFKPTVASVARQTKLTLRVGKLDPKLRIFTVGKRSVPEPRTVVDTIFAADELKLRTVTVYPIIPPTITWR